MGGGGGVHARACVRVCVCSCARACVSARVHVCLSPSLSSFFFFSKYSSFLLCL